MATAIVWFLIVTSGGYREAYTFQHIGPFPDKANCEYAIKQISSYGFKYRCINARILIPLPGTAQ